MRPIPDALRERFLSDLQTAANNADPKLSAILTHETVPLESSDFLERALIDETGSFSACSVAVRRPAAGSPPDMVYAAWIDEDGAHVKKSALPPKLSALTWTDVTPAAIESADDIAVAFNGSPNLITDPEPWVFWTDSGALYAQIIGSSAEPITLEASGCTKVSAIRGMSVTPDGDSHGFVVFYIVSGVLYYRTYNGTGWSAAEEVTLGPSGVTWTDITAFRTHDARIGVQAKAGNGQIYELFSKPAIRNYILFSSATDFTLKTFVYSPDNLYWNGALQYSIDGTAWSAWDGGEISSASGKLMIRGTNNTAMGAAKSRNGTSYAGRWVLTGSQIKCEGNIEMLLDHATASAGIHPTLGNYAFRYLFYECSALISSPELPSVDLTRECYSHMFAKTSIIAPPELPATTMAPYCYEAMFSNCASLISAPVLPATTLDEFCYNAMFSVCASLSSAPALPATTLASGCYSAMFLKCASLTSAPDLPATTLAIDCYNGMFTECTGLITGPASISATEIMKTSCYRMFYGCTSLVTAPSISVGQIGESGCSSMFENCTSLVTPPASITATSIGSYGCSSMFRECTSLTAIPALPATALSTGCYVLMFFDCSLVKISKTQTAIYQYPFRIPTSGTGTADSNATGGMFTWTGGPFTGDPQINTTYYTDHPPVT